VDSVIEISRSHSDLPISADCPEFDVGNREGLFPEPKFDRYFKETFRQPHGIGIQPWLKPGCQDPHGRKRNIRPAQINHENFRTHVLQDRYTLLDIYPEVMGGQIPDIAEWYFFRKGRLKKLW
jgi:hypothetical protein